MPFPAMGFTADLFEFLDEAFGESIGEAAGRCAFITESEFTRGAVDCARSPIEREGHSVCRETPGALVASDSSERFGDVVRRDDEVALVLCCSPNHVMASAHGNSQAERRVAGVGFVDCGHALTRVADVP